VSASGGATATFVYDGDGNRVKSTINTTTTAFIGNHTEWDVASSSLTRYYYAGSTRVAMRKNNTVYYLLSDHLGSTSLTTDENGQNPVKQYYLPWGEVRYTDGTLQTKYTYTGQYSNVTDFGLMYYNARYYDPLLSRFISADTIVPRLGNPLDWDRYGYTRNNPINYTDPSGHITEDEKILAELQLYGVSIAVDWGLSGLSWWRKWNNGNWSLLQLQIVLNSIKDMSASMGGIDRFKDQLNGLRFKRDPKGVTGHNRGVIYLADYTFNQSGLRETLGPKIAIVHELAHAWDQKTGGPLAWLVNGSGVIGKSMANAIGNEDAPTWYGTRNIGEDWAESAASYVYPEYTNILVNENDPRETLGRQPGLASRPNHQAYVSSWFNPLNADQIP
jgi:RHS repeat-associated protein